MFSSLGDFFYYEGVFVVCVFTFVVLVLLVVQGVRRWFTRRSS